MNDEQHARHESGKGDTSQCGDWQNARNAVFKGKPCRLNASFADPLMPHDGVLEFDFVSTARPGSSTRPMTEWRFISFLQGLGWVTDAECDDVLDELESAPSGAVLVSPERAAAVGEALARFHGVPEELAVLKSNRGKLRVASAAEPVEGERDAATAARRKETSRVLAPEKSRRVSVLRRRRVATTSEFNSMLFEIRYGMAGRWLSSRQCEVLVRRCPLATSGMAGWRVPLASTLHQRCVDLLQFDLCLASLEAAEHAEMLYRLGWLNLWSPLHPDCACELSMDRREERLVAKMYVERRCCCCCCCCCCCFRGECYAPAAGPRYCCARRDCAPADSTTTTTIPLLLLSLDYYQLTHHRPLSGTSSSGAPSRARTSRASGTRTAATRTTSRGGSSR